MPFFKFVFGTVVANVIKLKSDIKINLQKWRCVCCRHLPYHLWKYELSLINIHIIE